jgi:hypothetical protein
MIKLLEHLRDWTVADTDGAATVVINDAWHSPKAKKADVSAPDATKPRARSLAEHFVETASLDECHERPSAREP